MPDYGHPLAFGTFITPTNTTPAVPVDLAVLSERLGFDLVTFQDHPYQPGFLDTWTLMAWVAARTQTIHVSANVLNLPLRPPAVTARAAASLDLLSGGRFELGLGAGAFWDAIEAMGGRRLTAGQGVDALSEAIDVIRGIWDADERAPLRLSGEYYSVNGAKRGPSAAHDIPIWLGALKPRMLRLIGRKADGWLPSLAYLKPGDFVAGNATIDGAATDAGRDPREIRRLVNIGPDVGVEQLFDLAIENGVGTFILASDDPGTLQRFAAETIPDLRERVATERASSGTVQRRARSAEVLAWRAPGIDYESLPASLAATAVEPGDAGYSRVRATYMRGGSPGIVLRPTTTTEVADAVGFARAHAHLPLSTRSGGHGFSGRSTNAGGIIIDVKKLNTIEVVDAATRRVRIGPGARWTDVANALAPHGWALSSGDYGGVGVGGLATAGGVGYLVREHGLTIDHLVSAEIVLADGSVVTASGSENPDLFWAIRGAGANFGIVTSFEFEVDVVGDVGWAQLTFDASDTAGFLEHWGAAIEAAPRDLSSFLIMGPRRGSDPRVATLMSVVDSDDSDTIIERLQPLAELAPLLQQSVQLVPYASIMANAQPGDQHGQGEPVGRSALIEHITPEFALAAERLLDSGEVYWFQIRSVGGAVSDVAADATAYAGRSANFSIVVLGGHRDRLNELWDELHEHFSGLYTSFETDPRPERIQDAFPPATLSRLRDLKTRYDPANLFRDNFNVVLADA
jgi:FAD/FMN-containing dehydrogenase